MHSHLVQSIKHYGLAWLKILCTVTAWRALYGAFQFKSSLKLLHHVENFSVHSWYLSQKVDNRPNLFLISLAHIVKESFPLLYVFTIDMHHLCPCNDHEDAFTYVVSLIWKQHIVRQVGPHNWILNHSTNRACLVFPGDWGVCV